METPRKIASAGLTAFACTVLLAGAAFEVTSSVGSSAGDRASGGGYTNLFSCGELASSVTEGGTLANFAVGATALADAAVTLDKLAGETAVVSEGIVTNPMPGTSDAFGSAVVGLQNGSFAVGAYTDDETGGDAGLVFVYDSDAALQMVLTNPATIKASGLFGWAIDTISSNALAVGAFRQRGGPGPGTFYGAVHLFATDGTLLTSITNPAPVDNFGVSVCAAGAGRLLIGADSDDTGASGAGIAYLYDTAGNLLAAIENPAPVLSDAFGNAVAMLQDGRAVVAEKNDDTGANNAGSVWVVALGTAVEGLVAATVTDNAINSAKIADGSIGTSDIADGAIGGAQITDGTVANADLANSAVDSAKIADGSITSTDIADGTIVDADISATAAITGTKINAATTTTRGTVGLADHSERAAGLAVQADDPRLSTWTAITNIPYMITQPGGYYLTGNLTMVLSLTNAIIVNSSGVTLDLNGFSLSGLGSGESGAISVLGGATDTTIRNGYITGWGRYTVYLPSGCTLENLRFRYNGNVSGIKWTLIAGERSLIRGCVLEYNNGAGISAGDGSTLSQCTANRNVSTGIAVDEGSTLTGCAATENGGHGISAGTGSSLDGCTATSNTSYGISASYGSTLTGCAARQNNHGIVAYSGSSVINCSARDNVARGITAYDGSTVTDCAAVENGGDGILASQGTSVIGCAARLNGGNGIVVFNDGCTISRCTAYWNVGDGISVADACRVEGNQCADNGFNGDGAGVLATGSGNHIAGNNVTGNDRGVDVDGTGNLVIRNTASGNTLNYSIILGNKVGTVVTSPTSTAISGDTGGAGVGSTDPWANVTF